MLLSSALVFLTAGTLAQIYCFALAVSCCSAAFVLWCSLASTESVEPTHPAMGGHRHLFGCLQLWRKSKDALPCILDLCLTLRWGAAFKPVLDRFLSCRTNNILKGECVEDCVRPGGASGVLFSRKRRLDK